MTFAVLRALQSIIGDALDDIERIYSHEQADLALLASDSVPPSPPPSPYTSTHPKIPLDFPSLDIPYDPADPAEQLRATHPTVVLAINKIVAATGQISATVQRPFLSLFDASSVFHLPSCIRLLEASNIVEILGEAGTEGLHVDIISQRIGIESVNLAHILRLLATHHILRERKPNVFTLNRISSLLNSGYSVADLHKWETEGRPEMKYHATNGIAAFIGLFTDELQKTSPYLTEAYLLSRADPFRTSFQHAFGTDLGFFPWLEGEGARPNPSIPKTKATIGTQSRNGSAKGKESKDVTLENGEKHNPNKYRLERFGVAMSGSGSWEVPGAVLNGFDWRALPRGSVIVDVGGGIGSTSMLLANAFARGKAYRRTSGVSENEDGDMGFHFVVQDRPIVVEMAEKAWKTKYPELLESGTARFQAHDFFTSQPVKNAAVFLLRVVIHDWEDAQARIILLRLREAATEDTKLLLADFILPLACVDDVDGNEKGGDSFLKGIEGVESALAPAPLLANLGKASAHAYSMDLTMQTMFNAQERTLREIVALALSAGWKVVKVTRAVGSLFGHITAVPVPIPIHKDVQTSSERNIQNSTSGVKAKLGKGKFETLEHSTSRSGTPTFGSRTDLPSVQETRLTKFGGLFKSRVTGLVSRGRENGLQIRTKRPPFSTASSSKKSPPLPPTPSSPSSKPLASSIPPSSIGHPPLSPVSPEDPPSQGSLNRPKHTVKRKETLKSHPSPQTEMTEPQSSRGRSGSVLGASISGVASFLNGRLAGALHFGEGGKERSSLSSNEQRLPNDNSNGTPLAAPAQIN